MICKQNKINIRQMVKLDSSIIYYMILIIQAKEGKRGTFFSAKNTTNDGRTRKWTCRLGVAKYVNGTGAPYSAQERNFITVWDPNASGDRKYRQLNVNTLRELRVCKQQVIRNGNPTKVYRDNLKTAKAMAIINGNENYN
jgi:hypothetical protein